MIITADRLVMAGLASPGTAVQVIEGINAACNKFTINSGKRVAAFLAQCAHESCKFAVTQENLNYSAQALLKTFPKYFTPELASQYAKKPEKIANRVYANRMNNGPESSGDGWKFHGRGFIQLTGKHNYTLFTEAIGVDVVVNPDLVATPQYAALSAAWFWDVNKLNNLADVGDIVNMTKRINGGTLGLIERTALYYKALEVFK